MATNDEIIEISLEAEVAIIGILCTLIMLFVFILTIFHH